MNLNLETYVIKISKFIPTIICKETIKSLEKNKNWESHNFYDSHNKLLVKQSGENELEISNIEIKQKEYLMNKVKEAISIYMNTLDFPWLNTWQGYTNIRFNKYKKNKVMSEHCDHIHSMFDGERKGIPVLSLLGVLNDNYKGGDFIMFKTKKIELKTGDFLIFPSNFLFPHKVLPVTKGTRYSFISWSW